MSVATIEYPFTIEPRGATWGKDETILFSVHRSGILSVPAVGGTPTAITTPNQSEGEYAHYWPHLLPDGKHVLFTIYPVGDTNRQKLTTSLHSLI